MSLHYTHENSYSFVNRKEIFRFKADNKNVNFPTQFCLVTISNKFGYINSRKFNLYDFSVDYNAIDKSDILNIHKNLMVKNNVK